VPQHHLLHARDSEPGVGGGVDGAGPWGHVVEV